MDCKQKPSWVFSVVLVQLGPRHWEGGRKRPSYWKDGSLFNLSNYKHHFSYGSRLWEDNGNLVEGTFCLPCAYRLLETRDSREELSLIFWRVGLVGQYNRAGNLQWFFFAPSGGIGIPRPHTCFQPGLKQSIEIQQLCMFSMDGKLRSLKRIIPCDPADPSAMSVQTGQGNQTTAAWAD